MLEISPILKSLWRNRTGPVLIVVQLALSVAVISNALYFIQERAERVGRPTGIAEEEIVRMWMRRNDPAVDFQAVVERDMNLIRSLPGVVDAVPTTSVPFSGRGSRSSFQTRPGDEPEPVSAGFMLVSDHALNTLGLKLREGRDFLPTEVEFFEETSPPMSSVAIITRTLAEALYPDESAVGKPIYWAGLLELTVVGVVEQLMGAWPHSDDPMHVVLIPKIAKGEAIDYLVRTDGGNRHSVMNNVVEKLREVDQGRLVVDEKFLETIKAEAYAGDYAMIKILTVVVLLLVFVNALGILGLTSFWVNQRRRQIGIRRALGATRLAIMRYFFLENILLVLFSSAVGGAAAIVVSSYLVENYGFTFMPWPFIPLTGFVILVITLVAAWHPVKKASLISPAEAAARA